MKTFYYMNIPNDLDFKESIYLLRTQQREGIELLILIWRSLILTLI